LTHTPLHICGPHIHCTVCFPTTLFLTICSPLRHLPTVTCGYTISRLPLPHFIPARLPLLDGPTFYATRARLRAPLHHTARSGVPPQDTRVYTLLPPIYTHRCYHYLPFCALPDCSLALRFTLLRFPTRHYVHTALLCHHTALLVPVGYGYGSGFCVPRLHAFYIAVCQHALQVTRFTVCLFYRRLQLRTPFLPVNTRVLRTVTRFRSAHTCWCSTLHRAPAHTTCYDFLRPLLLYHVRLP